MSVSELEEKLLVSSPNWQGRLTLYLVHKGKKPACRVFKKLKKGEEEAHLVHLREIVDPLPFYPHIQRVGDEIFLEVFIGKDQEHLDALLEALEKQKEAHRAMGRALGYPPNAIEAFAENVLFPHLSEYPQELQELKRFLFFNPSQDNWQESIDYVTAIRDFVRETAPALYGHIQGGRDVK